MQASNRPKEAGMNRYAVWMMLVMAMACTPEDGDGGGTNPDAGPPAKAECLMRDHISTVTVADESIDIMWPVDTRGAIAPGRGNSTELPDLSCFSNQEPVASLPLNTWACVDIFGPGETVTGLEVALWEDDGSDRSQATPATMGTVKGCDEVQGADEAQTLQLQALCDELCEFRGMVHLPNAPGGVPVVARVRTGDVTDDGVVDLNDRLRMPFVDTWVYGVTLNPIETTGTCDEDCGDNVCFRGICLPADTSMLTAVAITENSYSTIPIVSGVGRIQGDDDLLDGNGNGAIAGAIADCNDDAIAGAAVASSAANLSTRTAYFQGDYPSPQKRGTEGDATYVLLNHPPGPALIAAFVHNEMCDADHQADCVCDGLEDAELTTQRSGERATLKLVGGQRVRVYPDSVTILSMRYGLMP